VTAVRRGLRSAPLVAVAAAVYVFLLAPFFVVCLASLDGSLAPFANFPPRRLSLAWYGRIAPKLFTALWVSLAVGGVTAVISGVIGTTAAFGIVRGAPRGRSVIEALFRLPLQVPFVVTGVVFLQFYYRLVDLVGVNAAGTLPGLVLAHVFVTIPYSVGTVAAVLARFNRGLEEAADSLGATPWATFWQVTFPLIRPGIFAGTLYAFIVSFGDVPVAIFLSGSSRATLPVEIFQSLQFDFDPSVLAMSTVVVVLSVLLVVVMQRAVGLDIVWRR
jgi:putative spermidine/putrescine transport system permease protein